MVKLILLYALLDMKSITRLARVNTTGEELGIVCGLTHERFALFHLFCLWETHRVSGQT